MKHITVILISGGSCSGKSILAKCFAHSFILEMDHFYLGKKLMTRQKDGSYDFDAPESVDIKGCAHALQKLVEGKEVTIPRYDMKISERIGTQRIRVPHDCSFIIVEGIFTFYSPLRELGNLKIYMDTPPEIRVARRMLRDEQKGRSSIETLSWSITVENNHQKYIEPMKKYADLIIPYSHNPIQFLQ